MAIIFPIGCDEPEQRLAFCLRRRGKMRVWHNKMGRWHRVTYAATKRDEAQAALDADPSNTQLQYALTVAQALVDANPPVTLTQYNKLPTKIKSRYQFAPGLTQNQWRDYEDIHHSIEANMGEQMGEAKRLLEDTAGVFEPTDDGILDVI